MTEENYKENPEEMKKMERDQNGEHGVITDVVDVFFDSGYEPFSDDVEGMINEWLRLTLKEWISLAKMEDEEDEEGDL